MMWFRSPEREAALRRAKTAPGLYACERCHKQLHRSAKKGETPQVHHVHGVTWTVIYQLIVEQLLCDASRLLVLCKDCHRIADREVRTSRSNQEELPL
jgi:formate-dependent nitrite reductase cytochrome c552 subunit